MTEQELIKQAFPDQSDLLVTIAYMRGMSKAAEEAGLDKEAFWGALARFGGAAIKGLGSLGKGVVSGGSKLFNLAAKPLERGFNWAGKGLVGNAAKGTEGMISKVLPQSVSSKVLPYAGQGMGKDMATFGLLGGGINAAMAPEGERGKAFLSGLAGGAAGGAAWRGASNLLGKGLRYTQGKYNVLGGAEGAKKMLNLASSKNPVLFGEGAKGITGTERLKRLGAKTLTKAVPFAGAWGASMLVPTGGEDAQIPDAGPGAGQYNPYGQSAGGSNGSW
jgi:hypothetical protein